MVDARKVRIGASSLSKVLNGVSSVTVVKGKKVNVFDLKNGDVKRSELAAHMIGPTGNLRAPTLRRGTRMVVGFGEEVLEKFLK